MNNETEEMVKRLSFENLIWIAFIVISALDIYGDELLKKIFVIMTKKQNKELINYLLELPIFQS